MRGSAVLRSLSFNFENFFVSSHRAVLCAGPRCASVSTDCLFSTSQLGAFLGLQQYTLPWRYPHHNLNVARRFRFLSLSGRRVSRMQSVTALDRATNSRPVL